MLGDRVVVDSVGARYVWEWANYPQYYVPRSHVADELLVTDGRTSVSRTPLADFCPPSRQTIVFCSRKPSFSVP